MTNIVFWLDVIDRAVNAMWQRRAARGSMQLQISVNKSNLHCTETYFCSFLDGIINFQQV